MQEFLAKSFEKELSELRFGRTLGKDESECFASLERAWIDAEDMLYGEAVNVISCGTPLLYARPLKPLVNVWVSISEKFNVRPDRTLLNNILERGKKLKIDVHSVLLDSYLVDDESHLHKFLSTRAQNETLSFGTMPLYRWYLFFSALSGGKFIELKYIAGIADYCEKKFREPPFIVKNRDNSVLHKFSLTYNISNIIECLLNICELRMSLTARRVRVNAIDFDLYAICDELAQRVALSPKIVIKEIRAALGYVVRTAGAFSDNPHVLSHVGADLINLRPASNYVVRKVDKKRIHLFSKCSVSLQAWKAATQSFEDWKLFRLRDLCDAYLHCNIGPSNNTSVDDFTRTGSLLLNLMRVAGYGRAQKYAAAPRSKPPKAEGYGSIPGRVENLLLSFHDLAIKKGIMPTSPEIWEPRCASYWKSTSAGVRGLKLDVSIDGGPFEKQKIDKKLAVGVSQGKYLFSRAAISKKLTIDNPGVIGSRDVPYKASRTIFVVPIHTQHAMIATTWHIVNYVSSTDFSAPLISGQTTCDHVASGSAETSGIRIIDNYRTIATSGSDDHISLDLDFSEFDSTAVYGNFRAPLLAALSKMGNQQDKFGRDGITRSEMNEFAFGHGYVHGTYWDIGREPLLYLLDPESRLLLESKYKFELLVVHPDRETKYKVGLGMKKLTPGTYYITKDPIDQVDTKFFSVGYRMDGTDLLYLTSHASGELTTLSMNSVLNLAIQDEIIENMSDTVFGRCVRVKTRQAVGDDVTILLEIVDWRFSSDDVDIFLHFVGDLCEKYGLKLSIPKTFFRLCSSEFVQTHATMGMYIPKDQIMMIPSEKPRTINDPMGFMESLKRLLLTKISRGYSESAATIITMYLYRFVTRSDLRRFHIAMGDEIKLCPESYGPGHEELLVRELATTFSNIFQKTESGNIWEFTFSSLCSLFPRTTMEAELGLNSR